MKALYREVIKINQMADNQDKAAAAQSFFNELNQMSLPEKFNWAKEIFEDLHVQDTPDKTALIWNDIHTGEASSFTYLELLQKANKIINFLSARGIGHGNNMYLMPPVVPQIWFASLACIKAGMVTVPTATTMTERELEFRFETYRPDVILADPGSADLIDRAAKETGISPKVKLILGQKQGWTSFEEIEKEADQAQAADTRSHETLFCFFTSGTTGLPKRVGHTASSYPLGHLSTTVMIGVRPDDVHHNLSAPGWAKWAWSSFFSPLNMGATATGFNFTALDIKKYISSVAKYKVNSFCAPPTAWRAFVGLDLSQYDLSAMKYSISAGEPLNPEVIDQWKEGTGTEIRDFYGQTESTAMIGNPPWMEGRMRFGSFGYPSYMYDVILADDEGNEITQPDETGHIVVRLSNWRAIGLFQEYIDDPGKTAGAFKHGLYFTGDKASFDKDGYWWFVGRADDVIKSSDYREGPFEVESALIEHPAVMETAVVGVPDPKRHQLVKAFFILTQGNESSKELALELFQHTNEVLAKFKIPRIIEFVTELPKTISGKIRRVELRENEEGKKEEKTNEYFYHQFPELSSKKQKVKA